ncbi:MAG: hypothetical protein J6T10_19985 [Methanobrevibacter sp.]|nr:hypothetical protein [Methanobrevibacter sp.]
MDPKESEGRDKDLAKLKLVNHLFGDKQIRTVWDKDNERYLISVVDTVGVLTESKNPRNYWAKLKERLKEEGNETVTNCHQLKLKASDGKLRSTDVTDVEGIFRIIESIPSKNAEPIKLWLAKLGKERVEETIDPSLSIERSINLYRAKGYSEEWIAKRIKGIQDRKKLTDVWKEGEIRQPKDYAILTDTIYKEWSGMTSKQYKEFKGLRKESLRDNMSDVEIALADLGEIATREIAKKRKPKGMEKNAKVAKEGGQVAGNARKDLEEKLGESVITPDNALGYRHDDGKEIEK